MAAPTRTRQTALIIAIVLATLEIGLFAGAWRLGALLDPGNDRRAALGFIVLGTALTLQAMVIVGVAWTLVAWSRTTLTVDDGSLALEHPWREWRGGWHEIRSAWVQRGWLTIEIEDQWRRWYSPCRYQTGRHRSLPGSPAAGCVARGRRSQASSRAHDAAAAARRGGRGRIDAGERVRVDQSSASLVAKNNQGRRTLRTCRS